MMFDMSPGRRPWLIGLFALLLAGGVALLVFAG